VNKRATGPARVIMGMAMYAGFALAEAPPANSVSTEKDLTAVIALQGLPCGQVVKVKQLGENDYVATCQDGNHYHVFVNADGRVMAEKQ
jgi:hypothetical protein